MHARVLTSTFLKGKISLYSWDEKVRSHWSRARTGLLGHCCVLTLGLAGQWDDSAGEGPRLLTVQPDDLYLVPGTRTKVRERTDSTESSSAPHVCSEIPTANTLHFKTLDVCQNCVPCPRSVTVKLEMWANAQALTKEIQSTVRDE